MIGAINGPSVTGGLELALNCDFLIASTEASFADTHARVGVMPGGGLTVLLPQWIGLPRALKLARTAASIPATPQLLRTYAATTGGTVDEAWVTEQVYKRNYKESDGSEVGRRYVGIRERGASQHAPQAAKL